MSTEIWVTYLIATTIIWGLAGYFCYKQYLLKGFGIEQPIAAAGIVFIFWNPLVRDGFAEIVLQIIRFTVLVIGADIAHYKYHKNKDPQDHS